MEVKYQTEKKENTILEQRASIAESELKIKQRNNLILGSLGLSLILGLLGYLLYNQQKLKNRQLKKEAELSTALVKIETQNRLQEQRLRISSDLHDNIGAQLTFIISSIDNLKYGMKDAKEATKNRLSKISEFTTQTIYELRDTIWAMNKEDISFEDLQVRVSNFIDKAKIASEKTDFNFMIAGGIDNSKTFSSVEGMNIYRIIQESVNNALKYAEAKNIQVKISEDNSNTTIEISDNGKGFDMATVDKGNGFNTITKRAKEIGGEAVISSREGKGTLVNLRL